MSSDWLFLLDSEWSIPPGSNKGGDKEAASIVTDGCNMGIKTICGYKNQYSGASKAVMEIADELTGMEENLRDCMKKFL